MLFLSCNSQEKYKLVEAEVSSVSTFFVGKNSDVKKNISFKYLDGNDTLNGKQMLYKNKLVLEQFKKGDSILVYINLNDKNDCLIKSRKSKHIKINKTYMLNSSTDSIISN